MCIGLFTTSCDHFITASSGLCCIICACGRCDCLFACACVTLDGVVEIVVIINGIHRISFVVNGIGGFVYGLVGGLI